MNKSLFVASLSFISVSVCGLIIDLDHYVPGHIRQAIKRREIVRHPIPDVYNSQKSKKGTQVERPDASLEGEDIFQQIDSEKLDKIKSFLNRRDPRFKYSPDLIEKALIYYCTHPKVSVENIAKKFHMKLNNIRRYIKSAKISSRTSLHMIDENKILEYYKSGGSFEDICKLVTSNRHFAKEKFANVISKQMTSAEKKQLVDENMDIITDYREKLLTDKGRIDKYKDRSVRIGSVCKRNFGECEDYLIRSIANSLGYDLSKIPVQWNIEYESISDVPGYIEQSIIEEDNKGFLTYDGIAKKCKTKRMIVGSVAIKKNGYRTFRRIAKSKSYKFVDLKKTTDKRLQENFGYKQSTAKRLKSYSNQYDKLNVDQKNLFKQILRMKKRKMPSDEDIDVKFLRCKNTRIKKIS